MYTNGQGENNPARFFMNWQGPQREPAGGLAQVTGPAQLLIIDETGYIPIDRQGANLFFQLISRRYEKGSILLTK